MVCGTRLKHLHQKIKQESHLLKGKEMKYWNATTTENFGIPFFQAEER